MDMSFASSTAFVGQSRKLASLVEDPSIVLTYHHGPLLSTSGEIPVHLIWYGQFTPVQCAPLWGTFCSLLGKRR
jgi:hypothetical protein